MFGDPDPPPTCHLGPWGGQSSFSAWQVLSDTWIRAFGNVQTCPILHPHPSSPSSNSIHILTLFFIIIIIPIHPPHPHPPPPSLFSILLLLTLHHHPPSHAWVSPSLPQPCESHPGCAGSQTEGQTHCTVPLSHSQGRPHHPARGLGLMVSSQAVNAALSLWAEVGWPQDVTVPMSHLGFVQLTASELPKGKQCYFTKLL